MYFLQPLALLFLGAALVPPLLHLFERRRPPDVEFPAVRYLRQTEREASRTIRLRHLLLLLLRVAAVALLALAAARPVVRHAGAAHQPTAVALVLDHSLSSGAVSGGVRAFDDLAARARETLLETRASDVVWLIGADGIARRGAREELLRVLADIRPEARRLDLSAAVATASRLVRSSGYAQGEVHVLSDLQRTAFGGPDSAAAGLPLLFYHPRGDPPANRGIVSARATPATWLAGTAGAVAVEIGGAPAPGAKASVTVAMAGRAGGRAMMGPGDVAALAVPVPGPGYVAGEVQIEPDELRADDRRPFAARVVAPATVVASAQAEPGRFVNEALQTLAAAGQIRLGSFTNARGNTVLLGERAGAAGASAVVFPPHDPVEVGAVNRSLAAAGVPWRLGARIEREDTLSTAASLLHPIAGAQIHRRYRLEPTSPGGGGVLARAGGDPWLVAGGRVVVVGSRLVPEETALPLSSSFVPFVGALVNLLARGDAGIVEAAPGESVPLSGAVTAIAVGPNQVRPVEGGRAVAAPEGAGRTTRQSFAPPARESNGPVITAPEEAGVYPLLAGADTVGELVVAPDPRESDLRRATASDLAALFPGASVTMAGDARAYAGERFKAAGRAELTGAALLAALVVLVVEGLVAAGGVRRRA
ncbi:MAG TPA: BatA domain-containing protein [Gemmatimonadales bacterium]|nr:BatA domain-containing protein [Gemmatimonadales bacterium]